MDFSRMKDIFKKENLNNALDFIKKHMRYFAAGALFVVLVLVLVYFVAPKDGKNPAQTEGTEVTEAGVNEEAYQIDAFEDVNSLISQYYTAYAAGDLATLTALATPVSENEQSYITLFGQYVDEYQNIKCYTKTGLDAGSYLVSVAYDIKFTGVDTTAPGLDFCYVRTNEQGALYIDNLYSQYNLTNKENALDTSIDNRIGEFEKESDVTALKSETETKYAAALAADENLSNMINVTIPNAITEWAAAMVAQNPEEPADAPTETPEEPQTEVPEETPPETPEEPQQEEPAQTTETLTATDRVNVRAAADTSSEKLGAVEMGATVTRTGTEGEWSIIDYNGTKGYIKSEYLTADPSSLDNTDSEPETGGSIAEGKVITLEDTVNIRSGMSETSDRIGTAYAGEKVTVVMSYAEGWTKVTWNNKSGYIKTSLLQ